jgi:hypothetical protein
MRGEPRLSVNSKYEVKGAQGLRRKHAFIRSTD